MNKHWQVSPIGYYRWSNYTRWAKFSKKITMTAFGLYKPTQGLDEHHLNEEWQKHYIRWKATSQNGIAYYGLGWGEYPSSRRTSL